MSNSKQPGRFALARHRRRAARHSGDAPQSAPEPASPRDDASVGWDVDATPTAAVARHGDADVPVTAQILSLLAEPGVHSITTLSATRALERPRTDIENALEALFSAGELTRRLDEESGTVRYTVPPGRKAVLEAMFREAAHDLGETTALAEREPDELLLADDDEPRLPVTAGLLSVFLPGTGQLLNGDVGRASLVFAVWSLALLTNLYPIWTFVCLYAGAEAFFTAKVRGMERKLDLEAAGSKS